MANVAPANVAKEFRSMLMKVAQQLTEDEMSKLSYEEGFSVELPPGSSGLQDVRILFLHKLEAKGVFSPKNPDGFANLLERLPREDLLVEVNKYKEKCLSVKPTKKSYVKPKWKKSKEGGKTPIKKPTEVKQFSPTSKDIPQDDIEDMFALAMTHASSLMSVLEELRELMQQPLPREKLTTIVPQVKEAIAILSKEEKTVTSVCQEMKRIADEVYGKKPQPNSRPTGNKEKKLVLSLPTPKKPFLTRSVGSPPAASKQDGEGSYCEVATMSTLGQGYETYDQVPIRNRPTPSDQGCYDSVPAQRDKGFYSNATSPSCGSGEQSTYDNIVGTLGTGEEANCYDEIVDPTELDENNYGVVRYESRDRGLKTRLPGNDKPKQALQYPDAEPKEELVDNPMYAATASSSDSERDYMALLKQNVAEDEDSLYTNVMRRP